MDKLFHKQRALGHATTEYRCRDEKWRDAAYNACVECANRSLHAHSQSSIAQDTMSITGFNEHVQALEGALLATISHTHAGWQAQPPHFLTTSPHCKWCACVHGTQRRLAIHSVHALSSH
eukprot:1138291-Pelagomonas_calceolata.AAC.4